MDSQKRAEWAAVFEKIAERISTLAWELTDNKDVNEFLKEMEGHHKSLGDELNAFKKIL